MTRKRGTALRAALIASLAVAFGVGSSALATTPPSEPAGGGGECPRDVAAAAAAATTTPETTAAPATTAAAAAPATTAAAAPETTAAAPETTAPPPTLPENVSELDAEATSNINPQPRDSLQQGGTLRLDVSSLAENWNPQSSRRQRARLHAGAPADELLPVDLRRRRRPRRSTLTSCTEFEASEDLLTLTYTLNPRPCGTTASRSPGATGSAIWNALNGLNPEFQIVSDEGYDLITSVEQGADEFEVVVTFCEPYPDYEALFSETRPAGGDLRPGDVQHRMGR